MLSLFYSYLVNASFAGLYTNNDGIIRPVAVKTLKDNYNQDAQTDFEREVEIMSAFTHENILKLEGVVFKDEATFNLSGYIISRNMRVDNTKKLQYVVEIIRTSLTIDVWCISM
ncbi:hypothetical protein NPIL_146801 [Nephila pilipes]|uniref:Serine-threonine/tyrosine-protein kinase catalytic domain-containing protein n=1 Tax=Nephila pilipes TaxID=299642 RepID=A0A8X6NA97_NEPPI|nr:hypothetical protein NPIL_146801 [Nephila pilipes]